MKGDFTRATFNPAKHYRSVLKQQGRVDLDADWNEQDDITSHRVETEALDVIGPAGAPAVAPGFALSAAQNGANLSVSAGRAYLDGILCENEQDVLITAQPDLPGFTIPTTPGMYIAYLEVWFRHLTALDDDHIRESALGGPDTCTRAKTVWQVGLLRAGDIGSGITCSSSVPAWDSLIAASTGTLAARSQPDNSNADPCIVPAKAGFRRLENQLYRVEVHNTGAVPGGPAPTFKWSRDNGSVVTAWQGKNGDVLQVSSAGRDAVLGFGPGQWVELTDDTHELNFQPGTLVQLLNVQGQSLTIAPATATGSVNYADFPLNPKVRRWDSAGLVPLTAGAWLDLEDGVQVEFANGTYQTGDYWMIPARTLKGDVEWPLDAANAPLPQPAQGIQKHYCRLAIVQWNGTSWSLVSPCLPIFPPLTGITSSTDDGIHILGVRTINPDQDLLNDADLPLDQLIAGIRFLCDAPVSPVSVKHPTCFLTLDLPYPLDLGTGNTNLIGFQPLVLPGTVQAVNTATSSTIVWKLFNPGPIVVFLQQMLLTMQKFRERLLARITLKCNFIWSRDNPLLFLDGEVFGQPRIDPTGTNIGLRLPQSGNGKRGGDFEMWFWLTPATALSGLTFPANGVAAGQSAPGTLTLTGAAPQPSGAVVTLSAQSLNAAGNPLPGVSLGAVPPSVTIPAGATGGTFQATTTALPPSIGSAVLRVTASLGGVSVQGDLAIHPGTPGPNPPIPPIPIPIPTPIPTPGPLGGVRRRRQSKGPKPPKPPEPQ